MLFFIKRVGVFFQLKAKEIFDGFKYMFGEVQNVFNNINWKSFLVGFLVLGSLWGIGVGSVYLEYKYDMHWQYGIANAPFMLEDRDNDGIKEPFTAKIEKDDESVEEYSLFWMIVAISIGPIMWGLIIVVFWVTYPLILLLFVLFVYGFLWKIVCMWLWDNWKKAGDIVRHEEGRENE
jgi:hypothetical protein